MPSSRRKRSPTIRRTPRYGWIPDLPDKRDFIYSAPVVHLAKLPPSVDLRSQCPSVYDQGQLGSCTANAIGAAIEFTQNRKAWVMPSRLFIYYNERAIEGTVNQDSGAQIRDGIKTVATQGACPESMWPYDGSPFPPNPHLTKKPTPACYTAALKCRVTAYHRVPRVLQQMKACLSSGYPFVIGFTVYESFESNQVAKTGVMNEPQPGEHAIGGHAVLVVGYDDKSSRFIVRNSWGRSWGMKGYFTMPYHYLLDENLSDDFWTIQ
jgi:C1A family cysteine protease